MGSESPHGVDRETGGDHALAALIERWQADHDAAAFEEIVNRLRGPLERLVVQEFRRRGIRDPDAGDDVMSLVFARLCRLGMRAGGRSAARFDASRARAGADPGWAFVRCVARSRVRDVVRGRRRWARRSAAITAGVVRRLRADEPQAGAWPENASLRAAVARLDERSRTVIELLLAGKSQAVIAHVLGVCEGTVSRIRGQAIARLRSLLDAGPRDG